MAGIEPAMVGVPQRRERAALDAALRGRGHDLPFREGTFAPRLISLNLAASIVS